MPAETWGMLPKSQEDPETIEEAIGRMIAAHNDDETAHLGPGQALHSHKASEIIDHLVASVVEDKLAKGSVTGEKLTLTRETHISSFESLDGWTKLQQGNGLITSTFGLVKFSTPNIAGQYVELFVNRSDRTVQTSKNPMFQVVARLDFADVLTHWLCCGRSPIASPTLSFGFKASGNTLYAVRTTGGVIYTIEIPDVDLAVFHTFRAKYTNGAKIEYFVDGDLVATAADFLPTFSSPFLLSFASVAGDNISRSALKIAHLIFEQDF